MEIAMMICKSLFKILKKVPEKNIIKEGTAMHNDPSDISREELEGAIVNNLILRACCL